MFTYFSLSVSERMRKITVTRADNISFPKIIESAIINLIMFIQTCKSTKNGNCVVIRESNEQKKLLVGVL